MIAFGTRDHSLSRRRPVHSADGVKFMKSEWMETGTDRKLSPTVFLIEQPAGTTAQVHFHRQNQYQLFVAGTGAIGGHAIAPLTVHYAGAHTGYGPLVAGPDGLQYLTLRPVMESGAQFIPQDRAALKQGPKRGGQAGPVAIPEPGELANLEAVRHQDLLAANREGRAASLIDAPAGHTIELTPSPGAQGCFAVILAGSGSCGGRQLGEWESVFVSPDESAALAAGAQGVSVVLLSVPPRDPAYGDPDEH